MQKVVVFGGSGFLGSYVIDELIQRGYQVICADILPTHYSTDQAHFIKVDIMDLSAVEAVVTGDIDIVYNYAGLADINVAVDAPVKAAQLNILGNLHILEASKKAKVKRFVYASSAYASSGKGSFYGVSKLSSEKFVEEFHERYGLNYTILRYGSLYGERADNHNGIYRLLKQAIEDRKIIHAGNGEEVREYIHCKDAAKLSVDALDPIYMNRHLMLTGVEKLKYKDLLTMIQEIFNDEIEIEFTEKSQMGHYYVTPYSFKPSVAQKLVNNPYMDLGQGLLECALYLHQQIRDEVCRV